MSNDFVKLRITGDGIIAARRAAGQIGFAINNEQMQHILSATIPHTVFEGELEAGDQNLNSPEMHRALNENFLATYTILRSHEQFIRKGLIGRLRWLILGKT